MRRVHATWVLAVMGFTLSMACGGSPPTSPTPPSAPNLPPAALEPFLNVTTATDTTAGYTGTFNYAGQSVTVPSDRSYTGIRFNWYDQNTQPTAFGNLYLLTQEYLDLPGNLGTSTPGYLARSESVEDGEYRFPTDVKLVRGIKYWFYSDAKGSFWGSFDTDIYPGGDMYVTGVANLPFRKAQASGRMVNGQYVPPPAGVYVDANFRVRGIPSQ